MARNYERELDALYLELAKLQDHQQKSGLRVVMLFEGRDAAGKGGTIRTYLKNLNPRYSMSVALPKPTDREYAMVFQRYVDWLPAAGEQVLFDRSWYNRAGVEPVMGFSTPEQTAKFLEEVPNFERLLVNDGIHLFKFWLSIGREMRMKRFHERVHDPLKRWKMSPVDYEALARFDGYSEARNRMFRATHTAHAPWTVVLSNDKRRARIAVLRHILRSIDYEGARPRRHWAHGRRDYPRSRRLPQHASRNLRPRLALSAPLRHWGHRRKLTEGADWLARWLASPTRHATRLFRAARPDALCGRLVRLGARRRRGHFGPFLRLELRLRHWTARAACWLRPASLPSCIWGSLFRSPR